MKKFITVSAFLICFLLSPRVYAFVWPDFTPLIPFSPQFCAMCIPPTISNLTSTYSQVNAQIDKVKEIANLSNIKQSLKSYGSKLGKSVFSNLKNKVKRQKVITYARTIEDSKLADLTDPTSVSQAFIYLFLQHRSSEEWVKRYYKRKGEQLKFDTTLEMYITAKEMEKELAVMLAELDNIEKCLVAGEDCSEQGLEQYNCQSPTEGEEDKVCLWRNALTAVRIYDKIMRYNEFLVAMNAQFDSVRLINTNVQIREYEGSKSKDMATKVKWHFSANEISTPLSGTTAGRIVSPAAYAEVSFETLPKTGIASPVSGREADFEGLELIAEAQEYIDRAISAHNAKQMLPDYLKIFASYNNMKAYHDKTLENLQTSIKCSQTFIGSYYTSSDKSWFGNKCSSYDGRMMCHYTPERAADDNSESSGLYDLLCKGDTNHKCFVADVYKSELTTSGIASYLYNLRSEASADESSIETDAYIVSKGSSGEGSSSKTSLEEVKKQSQSGSSDDEPQSLIDPAQEEEVEASSRERALLNWTLGKKVISNISKDLEKSSPLYGNKRRSFAMWNDQRYFYNQYLEGKYNNIKEYIKNAPAFSLVLDLENIVNKISPLSQILDASGMIITRSSVRSDIQKLESSKSDNPTANLDSLLQEEATALDAIVSAYQDDISGYSAAKTTIYDKLKAVNTQLSEANQKYNDGSDDVSSDTNTSPQAEEGIEYGETMKHGDEVAPQTEEMKNTVDENSEKSETGKAKQDDANISISGLEDKQSDLQKKLDNIDEKIEKRTSEYVKAYSDKEYEFAKKIAAENSSYENVVAQAKLAEIAAKFSTVGKANDIVSLVRNYAINKVDEAYNKIMALSSNDVLYKSENSSRVKDIHNQMIYDITHITLEDLDATETFTKISEKGGADILKNLVNMFSKICEDTNCTEPDDEYFVGIVGKKRDFRAPKAPVDFASAPLREVFHFDLSDYNDILKYQKSDNPTSNADITLIGNSILDSGLEVPEIWQYILQHRAYVEKEIDYETLLNQGNPAKSLMRGGIFPCKLNGKTIDVIPATSSQDIRFTIGNSSSAESNIAQDCQGLTLQGGKLKDAESGETFVLSTETDTTGDASKSSELGQILESVTDPDTVNHYGVEPKHKLTIRQALLRAVYVINNSGENADNIDKNLYVYNRTMYSRNQLGDYLDFVEQEQTAADNLAKVELQVADVRTSLNTLFTEAGYELKNVFDTADDDYSEKFDLTIPDDYQKAEKTLENIKSGAIKEATEKIDTVQNENGVLDTKLEDVNHQIEVLEKDADEVVQITGTEDLDDLEEQIKTEEANRSVVKVYEDAEAEEMDAQSDKSQAPYCAVYPL